MAPGRRGRPRRPPHASGVRGRHHLAPFDTTARTGRRRRCVEIDIALLPSTRSSDEHRASSIVLQLQQRQAEEEEMPYQVRRANALLFSTALHADEHGKAPHDVSLHPDSERGVSSPVPTTLVLLRSVMAETRCRCGFPYKGASSESIGDWF